MTHSVISTNDRLAFNLLKLYTFCVAIVSSAEVLRLSGIFNVAELNKGITVLIGLPALLLVFTKLSSAKLKSSFLGFILAVLWVNGLYLGLVYQHNYYYLIADTATFSFALILMYLFSSIKVRLDKLRDYLNWAANILLVMSIIGIFSSYLSVFVFGNKIYFSFGSISLLLPMVYYLVYGKKKLLVVTVLTIFVGGKVGVMVAALVVVIFQFWGKKRVSWPRLVTVLIASIMLIAVSLNQVVDMQSKSGDSIVAGVLGKLKTYSYSSFKEMPANELIDFGGGRFAEVYYSWQKLSTYSGYPQLTGAGFGFVYDSRYNGTVKKNVHNVHISFITLVLRHGIILTIVFYISLFAFFAKYYKRVFQTLQLQQYQVLYLFCLGSVVFSFTAFNLFATLFNWFFIGLLIGIDRQVKKHV